ncbi:hypothetical protein J7E95_25485 [Streptomyces sp. ISL-14]|nr:hypothetical protein [Streptomyces sp. ISL-14]
MNAQQQPRPDRRQVIKGASSAATWRSPRTGFAAALLPVPVPLRPILYPLTLVMLIGTLVCVASRLCEPDQRPGRGNAHRPTGP